VLLDSGLKGRISGASSAAEDGRVAASMQDIDLRMPDLFPFSEKIG
jgi:hypothetical protein